MSSLPPGAQPRVKMSFFTRDESVSLTSNPGIILVPTNIRRLGLSQLVNSFLGSEKPIPFEFLINNQFLRSTTDEFLTTNGLSGEETLNVEYTRALIPPLHVASFEHDEWVSGVDVLSASSPAGLGNTVPGIERILSSSHDGLLRVWDTSGNVVATSSLPFNGGHIVNLKTAKFLNPSKLVAGGMDRTLRLYDYSEESRSITNSLELYGHERSIEDVAVHAPSSRILTASADDTVGVWSSKPSEATPAPSNLMPSSTTASNKRLKTSKPSNTVRQGGALSMLSGHTGMVQAVIFAPNDATVAYSASQDHTLRTWDLPTSKLVDTRTTGQSLYSLTCLPELNTLATGSMARHITLIDPRVSASHVSVMTLRGHTNAVSSLDTDPNSRFGLVSGSHDGTCRIWDIRSVRAGAGERGERVGQAVYVIERDSAKGEKRVGGDGVQVYSVCWNKELGIVSGGQDQRVQINKAPEISTDSAA